MKMRFTQKQKIMEICSIGVWIVWLIATFTNWNTQTLSVDNKNSIVTMLIVGFIIYCILSFFTIMPEATNIVTGKKYNEQTKSQIINLSRNFFSSIKLILILGFSCLSIIPVFNPKLEGIIITILVVGMILSLITYVLDYRRIQK